MYISIAQQQQHFMDWCNQLTQWVVWFVVVCKACVMFGSGLAASTTGHMLMVT